MRLLLIFLQETTNGDTLPNKALEPTQMWIAPSLIAFIVAVVAVFIGFAVGRRTLTQGRPWLDYGNFFIVALGLVVVIIGFLVVLMFLNRFATGAQALSFFAALTGATLGLVGTFFGIKTSLDLSEGALRLASNGIAPLTVTAVIPPEDAPNVNVNTDVTATFSRAVLRSSITLQTFQLVDLPGRHAVQGTYSFDTQDTRVTFIPDHKPLAAGPYQATITTGVTDQSGNKLGSGKTWTFTIV